MFFVEFCREDGRCFDVLVSTVVSVNNPKRSGKETIILYIYSVHTYLPGSVLRHSLVKSRYSLFLRQYNTLYPLLLTTFTNQGYLGSHYTLLGKWDMEGFTLAVMMFMVKM